MNGVDVGHHGNGRPGDLRQQRQLTEGVGAAHLEHGDFFLSANVEEGQGQPDLVVEVAGTAIGPVSTTEDGRDDFLGRSLADAASDPDHAQITTTPDGRRQLLERRDGVIDDQQGERGRARLSIRPVAGDDRGDGTGLPGLADELVAIKRLTSNGNEDVTGPDPTAVPLDRRDAPIGQQLAAELRFEPRDQGTDHHRTH